jgi:hypothetical protein
LLSAWNPWVSSIAKDLEKGSIEPIPERLMKWILNFGADTNQKVWVRGVVGVNIFRMWRSARNMLIDIPGEAVDLTVLALSASQTWKYVEQLGILLSENYNVKEMEPMSHSS